MKLQRWNVARGGLDTEDVFDDKGEWVRWADVDALLASIREAVEAEREAVFRELNLRLSAPDHEVADTCQTTDEARAALDALLSGEGA